MSDPENHCRHLDTVFSKAHINTRLYPSAKLKTGEGTAEITLEIADSYHHGMHAVHGSVYFKLLDDAAYFAANSAVTDVFLVTTSFHIHMLRPVHKGTLYAKGTLRMKSRSLLIADAEIHDENGKEVAYGTGHFAKSRIPIDSADEN